MPGAAPLALLPGTLNDAMLLDKKMARQARARCTAELVWRLLTRHRASVALADVAFAVVQEVSVTSGRLMPTAGLQALGLAAWDNTATAATCKQMRGAPSTPRRAATFNPGPNGDPNSASSHAVAAALDSPAVAEAAEQHRAEEARVAH